MQWLLRYRSEFVLRTDGFVDFGNLGVRFMIWSTESGAGFSLVEHPIPPRTLCAPLHRHSREDEYSFVLDGRMGAILGDDVVYAEAGDLVSKPRNQSDISQAGGYADPTEIGARHGLEFDLQSIERICAEHGLVHHLPGEDGGLRTA